MKARGEDGSGFHIAVPIHIAPVCSTADGGAIARLPTCVSLILISIYARALPRHLQHRRISASASLLHSTTHLPTASPGACPPHGRVAYRSLAHAPSCRAMRHCGPARASRPQAKRPRVTPLRYHRVRPPELARAKLDVRAMRTHHHLTMPHPHEVRARAPVGGVSGRIWRYDAPLSFTIVIYFLGGGGRVWGLFVVGACCHVA